MSKAEVKPYFFGFYIIWDDDLGKQAITLKRKNNLGIESNKINPSRNFESSMSDPAKSWIHSLS